MKIVANGGSEPVGSKLVRSLHDQGHEALAASPTSGVFYLKALGKSGPFGSDDESVLNGRGFQLRIGAAPRVGGLYSLPRHERATTTCRSWRWRSLLNNRRLRVCDAWSTNTRSRRTRSCVGGQASGAHASPRASILVLADPGGEPLDGVLERHKGQAARSGAPASPCH